MKVLIRYGKTAVNVKIPSEYSAEVLEPAYFPGVKNDLDEIRNAINQPIGTGRLKDIGPSGRTVAIVVNDITRPVPSEKMLSAVIDELSRGGIKRNDITVVVATGLHRPNTREELREMLGSRILNTIKVVNHVADDESAVTYLGKTKRAVPVAINKAYVDADIKILTGLIRPHQIGGYSGGRKSVVPGIASTRTVRMCHSFPIRRDLERPMIGRLKANHFHEEITEAARMAGVDFIVNVVLNKKREIIKAVAGDLEAAWLEGVKTCEKNCKAGFSGYADVVLTSPGGYPCDINLWQSQKAMAPAELVVKDGGVIILVAKCEDGTGDDAFSGNFRNTANPKEVIEKFVNQGYKTKGLSKSFMYARCLLKATTIVVTDGVSERILNDMFTERASSVEEALKLAQKKLGEIHKIVVMPDGVDLLPSKYS